MAATAAAVALLALCFPQCDMEGGGWPPPTEYQKEEYIVDEQEWADNWDEGGAGWQDGGEGTGGFSADQSTTTNAPQTSWSIENELGNEGVGGEVEESDWTYQLSYSGPFDVPGIAYAVRITDRTFSSANTQCLAAPGADIDAIELRRNGGLQNCRLQR